MIKIIGCTVKHFIDHYRFMMTIWCKYRCQVIDLFKLAFNINHGNYNLFNKINDIYILNFHCFHLFPYLQLGQWTKHKLCSIVLFSHSSVLNIPPSTFFKTWYYENTVNENNIIWYILRYASTDYIFFSDFKRAKTHRL